MKNHTPTPERRERTNEFEFYDYEHLLSLIEGQNGEACRKLYQDHKALFDAAPGSASNHQTWPGGYLDHVAQTMNLFRIEFADMERYGWMDTLSVHEQFSLSDGLVVLNVHDLEKPFKYTVAPDGTLVDNPALHDKKARKQFRADLIDQYGIELNDNQQNALLHAEGVRDEYYKQGERVDLPLAALVHVCDLKSARVLHSVRGNGGL